MILDDDNRVSSRENIFPFLSTEPSGSQDMTNNVDWKGRLQGTSTE